MNKSYKLYKITNKKSKKVYIGYTCQEINVYWNKHIYNANGNQKVNKNRYFYRALKKYGKDNFIWEIIAEYNASEEAKNAEIKTIAEYKSNINIYGNSFGYNMTSGGDGHSGPRSEQTKQKISKSHIGMTLSEETRKKISESNKGQIPHNLGKHHSMETKKKMSDVKIGKKSFRLGLVKVDIETAKKIKIDRKNGLSYRKIANKYGISPGTVKRIIIIKNLVYKKDKRFE